MYLFFGGTIQNRTGEWRFCRPLPYRLAMVPYVGDRNDPILTGNARGCSKRKQSTGRAVNFVHKAARSKPFRPFTGWSKLPSATGFEPRTRISCESVGHVSVHLFLPRWGRNKWSGKRGSNPPPPPWQGGALPNELFPRVVPQSGVEPPTRGFSVPCSTY